MGHNATVVVMLDALHEIENDPHFGKKLAAAIMAATTSGRRHMVNALDVSAGSHCNAATVIEEHHSSQTAIVAVGGNYGTVLGRAWTYKHHEEEDKIKLLKDLAREYGYYIAKMPTRRSKEDDQDQ